MLSQTTMYAVRACLELARRYADGPVSAHDIAAVLDVPRNYLSKILCELGRAGIVESTRGPRGGFELVEPSDRILRSDIVGRFQPELMSDDRHCLLGTKREEDRPCPVHDWWTGVSGAIDAFFSQTTLADLAPSADLAPLGGRE